MDQQKPFIVIVDDDDDDRYLLHCCFSEIGLDDNVKFFGDSQQFMKYTELIGSLNVNLSLIILDYKMPYMNGKALINYLKAQSSFKEVPIIILTNSLNNENREKLMELGVTACHQKGLNHQEQIAAIKEIVKFVVPVA